MLEVDFQSQLVHEESAKNLQSQDHPNKWARTLDLEDQDQDSSSLCGSSKRLNDVAPLYQRVLSALIVEDESEEFAENSGGRSISFQYTGDTSPDDNCLSIESEHMDGMEFSYESLLGFQTRKQSSVNVLSCNGSSNISRATGFNNHSFDDHLVQGGKGFMHSNMGMLPGPTENNGKKPTIHLNASGISAFDCQYEDLGLEDKLLMELHSIGLYPETVVSCISPTSFVFHKCLVFGV